MTTPRLGSVLVAAALLFAACGDSAQQTTTTDAATPTTAAGLAATTTTVAATTTTAAATTTTATTGLSEEGTVDETIDTTPPGGLQPSPVTPQPAPPADVAIGEIQDAVMPFAELARDDLAARLDVEAAAIEIVTAELVVWPDSSLGCPQPDMAYLQVLSDGYRVLLSHDGAIYSYHGGGSRLDPFLCEQPSKPVQGATPGSGAGDS